MTELTPKLSVSETHLLWQKSPGENLLRWSGPRIGDDILIM